MQLVEEGMAGDFEKWKRGEKIKGVLLTVSFGMGQNKRSTGTRYDSNSGFTLLIEARI